MPIGNERETVRRQYRRETGLTTRMSIWHPPVDGVTPQDIALAALRTVSPQSLLEIGCGTGRLAERISQELPGTEVLATDQSERMVELTAERGVAAQVADADALPFADHRFDAVVAAWMLYHVPDLDRTLAEVRRVLRPGGTLVA
ncbi:MAG TPA: class I SAM-dependent methyltransferase, partial [Microlunatus sp.]